MNIRRKLRIAFLYNVRHHYPDPKDKKTQLEVDFDDPETIDRMIKHLKHCGYQVLPIEANDKAYLKLYTNKKKIDIVFNYSEGIYGNDREAQIPAILEMLAIPYTGSSPLTQALGLNKVEAKEIMKANGIPTLPWQVVETGKETPNLTFPLIVKPVAEGSGAGITNKSVVFDTKGLKKQVRFILQTFHEPALLEPFLGGPEYSVAMIGNPPYILPFVTPNHNLLPKNYLPLDSFEVKWIFEEEVSSKDYLQCPAPMSSTLQKKIEKICLNLWEVFHIKDFCRIDVRCDKRLNPYILEFNSPAGLIPPEVSMTSYFPLACRAAGIEYEEMLKMIIEAALGRYQM